MRRTGVALLLAASLAGCGGQAAQHRAAPPAATDGAALFASAGCAGCHTLAAAHSHGTTGPNLDQLAPAYDRIVKQVQNGSAGMPSFRTKLSTEQIRAVALYVTGATAKSRVSVAAAFKPGHRTVQSCHADSTCFQHAFADLADYPGPEVALARFRHPMRASPFVAENCDRKRAAN